MCGAAKGSEVLEVGDRAVLQSDGAVSAGVGVAEVVSTCSGCGEDVWEERLDCTMRATRSAVACNSRLRCAKRCISALSATARCCWGCGCGEDRASGAVYCEPLPLLLPFTE